MNLKSLALLVAVSQSAQLTLSIVEISSRHYPISATYMLRMALSVPMIVFFFYIWKKQKQVAS